MSIYVFRVPVEYFVTMKDFYEKSLAELPVMTGGMHRGKKIIRIYTKTSDSKRLCREVSEQSKSWDEINRIYNKRAKIVSELEKIQEILSTDYKKASCGKVKIINTQNKFDSKFFDSLKDCSNTFPKTKKYQYGGRNYRSRAEMNLAELLDLFGIEFKYDVNLSIKGEIVSYDFILLFRPFNRCAFLEYCGMCEQDSYVEDKEKFVTLSRKVGMYLGRDLFIIDADEGYTPGADMIKSTIIWIILQFCMYHFGRA